MVLITTVSCGARRAGKVLGFKECRRRPGINTQGSGKDSTRNTSPCPWRSASIVVGMNIVICWPFGLKRRSKPVMVMGILINLGRAADT